MLHYRFNLPAPCSATLAQMPLNEVVLHAEFAAGSSRLFDSFYANPTKEGLCAILKAANKKGLHSAVREEMHRRIENFI